MADLNERNLKSVEVASTYAQVLIGLASGIITAVLAVSPDLLKLEGLNPVNLKISLSVLAASIVTGLIGLGALVSMTAEDNEVTPVKNNLVTIPIFLQLVLFAVGIGLIVYVIPS